MRKKGVNKQQAWNRRRAFVTIKDARVLWTEKSNELNHRLQGMKGGVGEWGRWWGITSNSSIVVFSSWTFKSFWVSSSPGSWPPTSSLRYCWSILSKAAFRSFLNPWGKVKSYSWYEISLMFHFWFFSLIMSIIYFSLHKETQTIFQFTAIITVHSKSILMNIFKLKRIYT